MTATEIANDLEQLIRRHAYALDLEVDTQVRQHVAGLRKCLDPLVVNDLATVGELQSLRRRIEGHIGEHDIPARFAQAAADEVDRYLRLKSQAMQAASGAAAWPPEVCLD